MSTPATYNASDLDRFVIKPSIKELDKNYFKKLTFEKKLADGSKKNIIGYSFRFMLNEDA